MKRKIKSIFKSIYLFLMDSLHQSLHLEYRLLKRGYLLYQHEVLKKGKTFEIYVKDYLAEIYNFSYKNPRELAEKTRIHSKVVDIFTLRPDLIQQYFDEDFDFRSYKQLIKEYDTSVFIPSQVEIPDPTHIELAEPNPIVEQSPILDKEEQLAKVRTEILKYESGEKQPKHIGQRMFGYLLKANYFTAYNDEQRYEAWQKFTGLETKPEMSYLRDPSYNKNTINKEKFANQIKQIKEFFYLIGLKNIEI